MGALLRKQRSQLLTFQTLQDLLKSEYLTKRGSFNGKKSLPDDIRVAILTHTAFLDYAAPIVARVSYIQAGISHQLKCPECAAPLQLTKPIAQSSIFCSIQCSKKSDITKQKRKSSTLKKYGVPNIFNRVDIITKAVKDKFGVENVAKLESVKQKISEQSKVNTDRRIEKTKKTNLERYGVEHTSSLDTVKNKKKESTLRHYGVDHFFKSSQFKDLVAEIFGGKNPGQLEWVKEKIRSTKLSNYGNEFYNNSDKAKRTMNAKFGGHSSQRGWSSDARRIMTNPDALRESLLGNTIASVASKYDLAPTTVRNRAYQFNIVDYVHRNNQYEALVENLLTTHNLDYSKNNRSILDGKELDFYIPSRNIAIECNGIFWHSELMGKDKNYHLNKTIECSNQGIQLIHLWDYQFDKNTSLVISVIKSKLGVITTKIGARFTTVIELSSVEFRQFMENNHLQGAANANIKYGLVFEGKLVAAMGFGKSRFAKDEYEMIRFASSIDTAVIGGASKLFSHFLKSNPCIRRIISYSDRDISTGKLYEKLGFTVKSITPPSYLYFIGRSVYNRILFQKHKLNNRLPVFDSTDTEWQNMTNNGYNRFWNTGNYKYEYAR